MSPLDAALAVGGPNLVSGEGWDVAPLLLVAALLLLMRWARIPLRLPAILVAVTAGLLLDPLTDAFRRLPPHDAVAPDAGLRDRCAAAHSGPLSLARQV